MLPLARDAEHSAHVVGYRTQAMCWSARSSVSPLIRTRRCEFFIVERFLIAPSFPSDTLLDSYQSQAYPSCSSKEAPAMFDGSCFDLASHIGGASRSLMRVSG